LKELVIGIHEFSKFDNESKKNNFSLIEIFKFLSFILNEDKNLKDFDF